MTRRWDFHFAVAIALSIAVHVGFLALGRRVDVGPDHLPRRPRALAINLNNLHLSPELNPELKKKPKPSDQYLEDTGDSQGKGTGANASVDSNDVMQAPKADQQQAFLSRDPAGSGHVGDSPSRFTGPRGNGGQGGRPGVISPPAAPAVQAPIHSEFEDQAPSVPAPRPALVRGEQRHDAPTPELPRTAAPAPQLVDAKAPSAPEHADTPVAPKAPEPQQIKPPLEEPAKPPQYAFADPSQLPAAQKHASPEAVSDSKLIPQTKLKTEIGDKLTAPKLDEAPKPSLQVAIAPPAPDVPQVTDSTSTEQPTPDSATTPKAAASTDSQSRPRPQAPAPQKADPMPRPPSSIAVAPTGDGIAPGQQAAPADPAPQSDSESDPFANMESAVIHNGRLEVRRGRKIKTTRPHILISGLVDTLGLANPTVVLRVSIDRTGHVTSADILRSSGSNDLDQPCRVAMYDWWFEPAKNAQGQPIPDAFPFSISFR